MTPWLTPAAPPSPGAEPTTGSIRLATFSPGTTKLWPASSTVRGRAVRLDEPVADWRARIDAARSVEPDPARVDTVVVSHARAEVLASLLPELAARLRLGLPVGPMRSDGSLSALAAELQEDLDERSWPR